jgi:hypothetical protein
VVIARLKALGKAGFVGHQDNPANAQGGVQERCSFSPQPVERRAGRRSGKRTLIRRFAPTSSARGERSSRPATPIRNWNARHAKVVDWVKKAKKTRDSGENRAISVKTGSIFDRFFKG